METRQVRIPGAELEVLDRGTGEPVVFVQTALTADELLPLATDAALEGYRRIVYHRRGYAGSSPTAGPGSIARDAADCAALLTELRVDRAHVVGASYSGAIALQLATDLPRRTHSLALLEPPPVHTPSSDEFRAANEELLRTRRQHGPSTALDDFLTMVVGHDWRQVAETWLPGSVAQMQQDATTFFDSDLPALLAWDLGPSEIEGIDRPVLYVGGTDSGPWFAEVRRWVLSWSPRAECIVVDGADHSLPLTHAPQVARALRAFLERHPM